MNTKLSPSEKETAIHWDEESDEVEIYTTSPTVYQRLLKEGLKPGRVESWSGGCSWFFYAHKNAIRFKVGRNQCYIAGGKNRKKAQA